MRRARARVFASVAVLAAAGAAYASLVITNQTAESNPAIPDGSAGSIVFSIRSMGASTQITGFVAPQMIVPAGCMGVSIAPLAGSFPVALQSGSQAQFIATKMSSMPAGIDKLHTCTWDIATNPAMVPADTVTTVFHTVVTQSTPLDVQPQLMRMRGPGGPMAEQQRALVTNYGASMTANLYIQGDLNNWLSFAAPPVCTNSDTCMAQTLLGAGGSAFFTIRCNPTSMTPQLATLDVQDTNGSSLGSATIECALGSGGTSGSISIMQPTIMITGPQGMVASGSATVYTMNTGALGSAAISSLDPSMVLSLCGSTSCSYGSRRCPTRSASSARRARIRRPASSRSTRRAVAAARRRW